MFTASCRHCDAVVVRNVERLYQHHYDDLRRHLAEECPRIVLALRDASIGELLKEYRVNRAADSN